MRWRSRAELQSRLRRAGYEQDEISAAIDALESAGLVDDDRFARELVRDHTERRLAGARSVRAALREKGVSDDDAETALAGMGDEAGRALELASRRAARMGGVAPEAAFRRLYGLLIRRGYGYDVARVAASRALGAPQDVDGTGPEA